MKKILTLAVSLAMASSLFAYNPPVYGEAKARLTNPELMSGSASSAAGGPEFNVIPSSILYNPALPATSELITFDLSGTALLNANKDSNLGDKSSGGAFEVGVLVPTRIAAFALSVNGVFAEMLNLALRKSVDVHMGISKEVTDWLSLGANAYLAFYMGEGSDFAVGAEVGALAKLGDIGPLTNARAGLSVLNMGKPATKYETRGYKDNKNPFSWNSSHFPSIFTPRVGFAAGVFDTGNLKGSFSADVYLPIFFRNFITDLAFQVTFNDNLAVNAAYQFNLGECIDSSSFGTISAGVSYRFDVKSAKLASTKKIPSQGSVTPSFATTYIGSGVFGFSGGVKVDVGTKDTAGAEIEAW